MTRLSSTNFENFTSSYLFVQREDLSRNFLPTFARLNQAHRAELRLICTAGTTASRNDQVFQIRSKINREKKTLLDFRATVRTVQTRPGRVFLYKVFLVFPLSSVCVRARVQVRRSIETSNSRSIRSTGGGGRFFKENRRTGWEIGGRSRLRFHFGLSATRVVVASSQG